MKPTAADPSGDPGRDGVEIPIGREVSCRPIGFFFLRIRSQGHSPEALLDGIEHPEKRLTAPQERIDWESFRRLMANLGRIWNDEQLVQAGKDLAVSPWVQPFGSIARLLLSCDELFRWNFHPRAGVARQMLTCIENEMREEGDGRVVIDTTMAPGYEPSRELMVLLEGTLAAMPRVLGLAEARVATEPIAGGVRYSVDYPIHVSAFVKLGRALVETLLGAHELTVRRGVGGEVIVEWEGGLGDETFHRSPSASEFCMEAEAFSAPGESFTDPPGPGSFFYRVE